MLIRRLLESNRSKRLAAARVVATETVTEPKVEYGGTDETDAYAEAGASATLLFHYPPERPMRTADRYLEAAPVDEYSDCIIFEGDATADGRSDLNVYVTRPLPDGETLVSRAQCEVTRLGLRTYLAAAAGVELGPEPEPDELPDEDEWEVVEEFEIPDEIGEQLIEWADRGVPIHKDAWTLREPYAGLARAQVVVVNIYGEEERGAAEHTARELRRMREDDEIRKDILEWSASRRPIPVFVANLADRRDKNLKKALARIKQTLTTRS